MACITLLSDFGTRDPYVGIMKGVVLSINPQASLVDLTHEIDPHCVLQAAFTLFTAYAYFPHRTVHVSVVDPGVGSDRAIIAMDADNHLFLAPDNGLLTYVVLNRQVDLLIKIENDHFFRPTVSHTFHGRDIFAPVAAHLSLEVPLTALGPELRVTDLKQLPLPTAKPETPHAMSGTIALIDRFGNLITNIDHRTILALPRDPAVEKLCVELNGEKVCGPVTSYAAVGRGRPLLIPGSHGYLEIAVNGDSAQTYFQAQRGDRFNLWVEGREGEQTMQNQDDRHD